MSAVTDTMDVDVPIKQGEIEGTMSLTAMPPAAPRGGGRPINRRHELRKQYPMGPNHHPVPVQIQTEEEDVSMFDFNSVPVAPPGSPTMGNNQAPPAPTRKEQKRLRRRMEKTKRKDQMKELRMEAALASKDTKTTKRNKGGKPTPRRKQMQPQTQPKSAAATTTRARSTTPSRSPQIAAALDKAIEKKNKIHPWRFSEPACLQGRLPQSHRSRAGLEIRREKMMKSIERHAAVVEQYKQGKRFRRQNPTAGELDSGFLDLFQGWTLSSGTGEDKNKENAQSATGQDVQAVQSTQTQAMGQAVQQNTVADISEMLGGFHLGHGATSME